jgi:hypothetical protein
VSDEKDEADIIKPPKELEQFQKAINGNHDYAWSLHNKVAMCVEAVGGKPQLSEHAAAIVMKRCFDADVRAYQPKKKEENKELNWQKVNYANKATLPPAGTMCFLVVGGCVHKGWRGAVSFYTYAMKYHDYREEVTHWMPIGDPPPLPE